MSQYQDPKKPECDKHEACVDGNGYCCISRYPAWLENYLGYKRWKDGLDDDACDESNVDILHLTLKGDGTVELEETKETP